MICLILPLLIGFGIDCVLGDPHSLPHPVVLIGKTISALECVLRRIFPKTPRGERAAGAVLWLIVAFLAAAVPTAWFVWGVWAEPPLPLPSEQLLEPPRTLDPATLLDLPEPVA